MDKVVSYNQVQGMVSQIRSLRSGFITNFYWDDNKHPYWIAEETLIYDAKPDSFLLIHCADGFSNMYYIATDIETVLCHFEEIDLDNDVVVDVVTKGDETSILLAYIHHGFEKYKHLFRMSHAGLMPVDVENNDHTVIHATKDDVEALTIALYMNFDPLAEQLPSKQELFDLIDQNEILLIKDNENICGFIIFEIVGVTWYLRYWYTSPDYRNIGIGARLIKASLERGRDTKRQILWVMAHNENAIKRYEHYGFKRELMNDYILIKRK